VFIGGPTTQEKSKGQAFRYGSVVSRRGVSVPRSVRKRTWELSRTWGGERSKGNYKIKDKSQEKKGSQAVALQYSFGKPGGECIWGDERKNVGLKSVGKEKIPERNPFRAKTCRRRDRKGHRTRRMEYFRPIYETGIVGSK